jgi:myo-inositol catabolism protein IolS
MEKEKSLAFGGASLSGEGGGYGFGNMSFEESQTLLKKSFEAGIKIYDLAPIYGFGLAEKRVGAAFKGARDNVYFVTKGGVTWDLNKRVDINNSPEVIQKMLNQSLKDLQTEYIDLYFIHWPDPRHDIRGALEVLLREKEKGKIKLIGLSNTHFQDWDQCESLKGNDGQKVIDYIQGEFNFFKHDNLDIILRCEKENVPFMSWGTLDKGILSRRVKSEDQKFDDCDARKHAVWWKNEKELRKIKFKIMEELEILLNKNHHSGLELALAFNLKYPSVKQLLCGIKSLDQLDSLLKAWQHLPHSEVMDEALSIREKHYLHFSKVSSQKK